jgi:hypothetical protein
MRLGLALLAALASAPAAPVVSYYPGTNFGHYRSYSFVFVLMAMAIVLILDLDRPRGGSILVPQTALENLIAVLDKAILPATPGQPVR